jgi:hypothetical protein
MNFIVGLPRTSHGHDSIWVIVERLTKSAHFIPVGTRYRARQYVELYIAHIVRFHGIPVGTRYRARQYAELYIAHISERGSIFVA